MKIIASYVGDSSDGEEQVTKDRSYRATGGYVEHLNSGLQATTYKYEYIFKDIGARLLHHKSVNKKYRKIKESSLIPKSATSLIKLRDELKAAIEKATKLIKDKYIIGKYISLGFNLERDTAEDYFDYNEDNINGLISRDFPLLHEEESFLKKLKTIISRYSGEFSLSKFEGKLLKLYAHLYKNWGLASKLAQAFNIREKAKFEFKEALEHLISKEELNKILQGHQENDIREQMLENSAEKANYFLKRMIEEHKAIHLKEQHLLEYSIKNLGLFNEDTSNSATTFLAKIRAYHKFMRGIIKDMLLQNEDFPTKTLSFTSEVGTAIYKDSEHPDLGTLEIGSIHKVFKSGARTTMVYGNTSRLGHEFK